MVAEVTQDCSSEWQPGMIADPGDDLHLCVAGQERPRGDVELPELHRDRAFPPLVVVSDAVPDVPSGRLSDPQGVSTKRTEAVGTTARCVTRS